MEYFLQQLINGLTLGAIYGLIAIGYTMVYGIIGMINFAHGDIFMIGAFHAVIAFVILGFLGVSFVPLALVGGALTATLLTAAYGWTVSVWPIAFPGVISAGSTDFRDRHVVRAARNSSDLARTTAVNRLEPIIPGGVGSCTIATNGGDVHREPLRKSRSSSRDDPGADGLALRSSSTARSGRAQRACEQDQKMASLLGINVDRTISLTFVIGAVLAAVAGLLVLRRYGARSASSTASSPASRRSPPRCLGGIGSGCSAGHAGRPS